MQTRERDQVQAQLAQVAVELTREAQAGRDAGHDDRNEVVEITVCWRGELKRPEADIVERLVIDTEGLVGVLNKLVNRQSGIVRLKRKRSVS